MGYYTKRMLATFLCCAVLIGSGCHPPAEGTVEGAVVPPAPTTVLTPVQVAAVERGQIASHFETTSRIEAENRVDVLSKGSGQCVAVRVEAGETVEAGQTLALLERDELEAQVRQARINVQQQKAAYEIAERSYQEGIVSSVDRDNTRFAYDQARVNLEVAELQLRNQTITAPISGVVTKRLIQAGMIVSPGTPVVSIVDTTSYVLPIQVPEKELARLQEGQTAEARIDAAPDRIFETRVRRIYPSIDPASGTVRVLLDFDEADRPLLREAAFARVRLVMESRADALLAPRDAVLEEEGRNYVFLIVAADEDSDLARESDEEVFIAERREIAVGLDQRDRMEVLEGLNENDMVVIMGQHALRADAPVKVTNLEEELAARAAMSLEEALEAAGQRETTVSGDRSRHTHDALSF